MGKWSILLILLVVLEALFTGLLPMTRSELFGDLAKVSTLSYISCIYVCINIFILEGVRAIKTYTVLRASLAKREEHTNRLLSDPCIHTSDKVDNIPQRIQEDVKLSYFNRFTAVTEYWISGLILLYLIFMNYSHYYLVLAALVYAALSTIIAYLFNPKLTKIQKVIRNTEAEFRSKLDDVTLSFAQQANVKAGKLQLGFDIFTKVQTTIMMTLPFFILIPMLLSHSITFTELVEQVTTFELIVINGAILVTMFPQYIQARASKQRVEELNG